MSGVLLADVAWWAPIAIVGGAVLPLIAGELVNDATEMFNPAFFVPVIGYALLVVFAIAAWRSKVREGDVVASPASH